MVIPCALRARINEHFTAQHDSTLPSVCYMQGRRQLLRNEGGGGVGLSLYRAAGSNLRMVRPSLMSVMKLVVIRASEARGKTCLWT